MQDKDGYRMKFACYYPRVEYGESPTSLLPATSALCCRGCPPVASLLWPNFFPTSCPSPNFLPFSCSL